MYVDFQTFRHPCVDRNHPDLLFAVSSYISHYGYKKVSNGIIFNIFCKQELQCFFFFWQKFGKNRNLSNPKSLCLLKGFVIDLAESCNMYFVVFFSQ